MLVNERGERWNLRTVERLLLGLFSRCCQSSHACRSTVYTPFMTAYTTYTRSLSSTWLIKLREIDEKSRSEVKVETVPVGNMYFQEDEAKNWLYSNCVQSFSLCSTGLVALTLCWESWRVYYLSVHTRKARTVLDPINAWLNWLNWQVENWPNGKLLGRRGWLNLMLWNDTTTASSSEILAVHKFFRRIVCIYWTSVFMLTPRAFNWSPSACLQLSALGTSWM